MSNIIISEFNQEIIESGKEYDLRKLKIQDCTGCWSCWWKTPGWCIFEDLNQYYRDYVQADKAYFFIEGKMGFASGHLKTLFDRMIPLFLPYIDYSAGESMHVPRYDSYPDIYVYYKGRFNNHKEREIFEEYIHRVFYQFHSNTISIKPFEAVEKTEVN